MLTRATTQPTTPHRLLWVGVVGRSSPPIFNQTPPSLKNLATQPLSPTTEPERRVRGRSSAGWRAWWCLGVGHHASAPERGALGSGARELQLNEPEYRQKRDQILQAGRGLSCVVVVCVCA